MVLNFFRMADADVWATVYLNTTDLIVAVYAMVRGRGGLSVLTRRHAAQTAVLISFGAVLGIVSSFQLLLMAAFEVILCTFAPTRRAAERDRRVARRRRHQPVRHSSARNLHRRRVDAVWLRYACDCGARRRLRGRWRAGGSRA